METPGDGWEMAVNGVESRMIRTSCPINIKQPNELILKLTVAHLPAKSTRLIKDVFAVSSPASFFLFCVNVTPTIVCARLKIRQQLPLHLFIVPIPRGSQGHYLEFWVGFNDDDDGLDEQATDVSNLHCSSWEHRTRHRFI